MTKIKPLTKQLIYTCSLIALIFSAQSQAQAFPWGYSPLTGSNNWLWLSRSLFNPTGTILRSGYNAPYYLANSLAWNAAYAAGQGIKTAGKKASTPQYWTNPNNGINAPAVDQISAAPWYYPPRGVPNNQTTGTLAAAPAEPLLPTKEIEFMPVPSDLSQGASTGNQVAPEAFPLAAPDFRTFNNTTLEGQKNEVQTSASPENSQNPFTQAFIDHVNSKFGGDIGKALADKQMRAYAQALGIVEIGSSKNFDLPADRIELIKRILNDPNEDSLTKINTIRLLMKH